MANAKKQEPKKTIAQHKAPKVEVKETKTKAPKQPKENSVVNFLSKLLGVSLSIEQQKEVEMNLRLRATKGKKFYVRAIKEIPADMKIGAQERALFEALGFQPMSPKDWAIEAAKTLTTKQDPGRVLHFYIRALESRGLVKEVTE